MQRPNIVIFSTRKNVSKEGSRSGERYKTVFWLTGKWSFSSRASKLVYLVKQRFFFPEKRRFAGCRVGGGV